MRVAVAFAFIVFIIALITPKIFTNIGKKTKKRADVIQKEIKKKGRVK